MAMLEVNHIQKIYQTRFSGNQVTALKDVSFQVEEGEYIAIMGESGSGKSTLLNTLATLDMPTNGTVLLNGKNITEIPEGKLAAFRRENLGFVFQDFNLLDNFSVKDNIFLPLVLSKIDIAEMTKRITPLAKTLGIDQLLEKYPYEISGGQKQRVAAARALITRPQLVLADEPTGALDSRSSENLLQLFQEVNQQNQTIIMVTHSAIAASHANRILFIKDGQVFHQLYKGQKTHDELLSDISKTMTTLLTKGV
ncbi:hypothetical protein A5819_001479 [Enterococcus sp. 7E2_DIV0204]|uniref:ABC transporter ATP-binding protein n=1 Tax=unclassified Enterococcus TaxID=2608891 RepID=UPI000A338C34|nr:MULTISPECIES: ABC transporter ATP-binding protein [unclassified Enterococcus]OTN88987.1 hypothetical protein A5819_001479 [Enterococcus sp. 7E2_DIV0204]OTP51444.1 hypothetical protein A5884_000639 [Enterococcus sp. 7D2_DIV0200]